MLPSTPHFEIFTSLRYDPRLLEAPWNSWPGNPPSTLVLLSYHYDRLVEAAKQFQWPMAMEALTSKGDKVQAVKYLGTLCQERVDRGDDLQQPLRIRIILSQEGGVEAQSFPTVPLHHDLLYASTFNPDSSDAFQFPNRQLKVYMDTEPTPASIYTSYKTTARAHYDAARSRLGISPSVPEEVILYNSGKEVMEGSIRNVAFWRNGRWVTPGLESGCLSGTVRRWLIEQRRIVEGKTKRDEVKVGEWVLLFNAVEGCLLGIISSR